MPEDTPWQYRDKQCPDGKRYHCFEDGDGVVVAEGCYAMKKCMRGDVHHKNQLFFCLFVSGDNGAIIFLFLVRHYSVHEIMVVPNYKPSCKCSTTHSYQCIQCFCVCKQWFGCQCLGFFMCKQMLMHACDCTLGLYEHRMRVCSFKKLTGRKIPCCTREPNWCWYCTWLFGLTVYQLSYPAPILFFGLE